jgi:uncharacterized protein (DUF934 family)
MAAATPRPRCCGAATATAGELRAFGDLGRDHVFMLARVGFDSMRLGDRHDPQAALAAFHDFSLRYQGAVDDPVPLFRKRGNAQLI